MARNSKTHVREMFLKHEKMFSLTYIRVIKIKTTHIIFFNQIDKFLKSLIHTFEKSGEMGILINYQWEYQIIKTNVKGNLAISRKISCTFTLSIVNSTSRILSR